MEYFAISVASWLAAAPKAKTPTWRYIFAVHDGIQIPMSSICSLIVDGTLFSFAWMISVNDICVDEKNKKIKFKLTKQVNDLILFFFFFAVWN